MWSEIIKIKPMLDSASLTRMTTALSARFASVAKKFGSALGKAAQNAGSGIKNILMGGGIAGAVLGIANKLLNPLKETEETLQRLLGDSDDIVTNAKQFETTAGNLFKLQKLGQSVGLDPQTLNTMLTKFQGALAQARVDEKEGKTDNVLKNFTGETDVAEAFFQFTQALQKTSKDNQVLVQQEIFGEKLILKSAEFFQTDFAEQMKALGLQSGDSGKFTDALEKIGGLNDLKDTLSARRDLNDILNKSQIVNEGMVREINRAAETQLRQENENLKNFENLKAAAIATDKLQFQAEQFFSFLYKQVPLVVGGVERVLEAISFSKQLLADLVEQIKKIADSRLLKGLSSFNPFSK